MAHINDESSGGSRGGRTVRSLRELPQDVPPARDLWKGIHAEISKQAPGAAPPSSRSRLRPTGLQWLAFAAVVAALAVGVWIGRAMLPLGGPQSSERLAGNGASDLVAAAYVSDPRYLKQREQMIRQLETQLKALPPDTQEKVAASLTTIRNSINDIQAALGRDPGNALLQELLVNTYQDEMRVLTAVHEASDASEEI